MDIDKLMDLIADDLQINAMPFKQYCYEVKATHQIIRKHLTEQLLIPRVMPRTFSKDSMKKAYVQGYRKRAINSELKYDKISEQYAIAEFENWFKNLYEA